MTVALADKGILNLNDFDTPAPEAYFFGKRQLGVDIYDVYDRIILSEGIRGALRSGAGYGQLRGLRFASPVILSQFSGIRPLAPDGTVTLPFEIPKDFTGQVTLMAVAWSGDSFGSAKKDVLVREAVVSRLRLPKYLAPGDLVRASLSIRNIDLRKEIPFDVELIPEGPLVFTDPAIGEPFQTNGLDRGEVHRQSVELTAQQQGEGRVLIRVTNPLIGTFENSQRITVRAAQAERTRRLAALLEPHERFDLARHLREHLDARFMDKDVSVAVRISPDMERLAGLAPSDWLTPPLPHLENLIGYAQ